MLITALYVGTSMLAPLSAAEREINDRYRIGLRVSAYNCGLPLNDEQLSAVRADLENSDIVLIIHVRDGENGATLGAILDEYRSRHHAVIAFNSLPDLMRKSHLGKLDFGKMMRSREKKGSEESSRSLVRKLASWTA